LALARFVVQLGRLGSLTEAERKALLSLPGQYRDIRAKEDVPDQPLPALGRMLVLQDGLMASYHDNIAGVRHLTALHVPGDMCGLNTIAWSAGPTCLTALTRSRIFAIPCGPMLEALRAQPGLATTFWRYSSSQMAIQAEKVISLGSRDAKQRLAHLMCELAVRHGLPLAENAATFPLPLARHQLASAICVTPMHLSRTLGALRTDGLLFWTDGTITLPNRDRLARLADFDPGYLAMYLR
jgi:CRP-like cAMP-binding protein